MYPRRRLAAGGLRRLADAAHQPARFAGLLSAGAALYPSAADRDLAEADLPAGDAREHRFAQAAVEHDAALVDALQRQAQPLGRDALVVGVCGQRRFGDRARRLGSEDQLRSLMVVFRIGAVLLVGEALAWVIALLAQR